MTDRKIDPYQVCPDCFRMMDIMQAGFAGDIKTYFVCPVCNPERNTEPMNEKVECVICGDEACGCPDVCEVCLNWKAICSCEEDANDIAQEMEKGLDDGT